MQTEIRKGVIGKMGLEVSAVKTLHGGVRWVGECRLSRAFTRRCFKSFEVTFEYPLVRQCRFRSLRLRRIVHASTTTPQTPRNRVISWIFGVVFLQAVCPGHEPTAQNVHFYSYILLSDDIPYITGFTLQKITL